MSARVFIGNLNYRTTQNELRELLSEVGEVVDLFLPNDRETGRPRGFAFAQFETAEEAKAAIEKFNGHELGGRPLKVNEAEERPSRGGGGGRPPRPPRSNQGSGPSFDGFGGGPPMDGGGWGGGGGGGGGSKGGGGKPKGSRRGLRGRKRSL